MPEFIYDLRFERFERLKNSSPTLLNFPFLWLIFASRKVRERSSFEFRQFTVQSERSVAVELIARSNAKSIVNPKVCVEVCSDKQCVCVCVTHSQCVIRLVGLPVSPVGSPFCCWLRSNLYSWSNTPLLLANCATSQFSDSVWYSVKTWPLPLSHTGPVESQWKASECRFAAVYLDCWASAARSSFCVRLLEDSVCYFCECAAQKIVRSILHLVRCVLSEILANFPVKFC